MLTFLKKMLARGKRAPLQECLTVEFDDASVRVRVLKELDAEWNQSFAWNDIKRVCFKDGGLWGSDIVYVSLKSIDVVRAVPTDAHGGHEFFGSVCKRGLFPESVWRRASGDTSGGMHCWPEE